MTEFEALRTDLYQLTMGAAYLEAKKDQDIATFDLFVRKLPKDWGYLIACGVDEALDFATSVRFNGSDIEYLRNQNLFPPTYLDYLSEFKFSGDIFAVAEGTPVAANAPILRVTAPIIEAQILETALLNTVNFPTLVASKASRIGNVSRGALLAEFGLRRAQGTEAGLIGARAAYIGGFHATSDVEAGKRFGIPITGTHAHSFVMSFSDELEAFRAYVNRFPNNPTLLIDTYDVEKGAENASVVAKELEEHGKRLGAVRIDSGDLAKHWQDVRKIFDLRKLPYVKLIASNDLDEYRIDELFNRGAKYDAFGIGTRVAVGYPSAALSGVYKLVSDSDGPKIKLSSEKRTNPGIKQVYRQSDCEGRYLFDILALEGEQMVGRPLLEPAVRGGERVGCKKPLKEIREYSLSEVAKLPDSVRQLRVGMPYPLINSNALDVLIDKLTDAHIQRMEVAA